MKIDDDNVKQSDLTLWSLVILMSLTSDRVTRLVSFILFIITVIYKIYSRTNHAIKED